MVVFNDECLFASILYLFLKKTVGIGDYATFVMHYTLRLLVTDNTDIVTRRIKLLMMVLIKCACTKYIFVHLISIIRSQEGYTIVF